MTPTDFATHLTNFLSKYLPAQKNVSLNTIKAYRDGFTLLLRYCRDTYNIPPERLILNKIDVSLVLAFLDYLETKRTCAIRTRNHRLAALHAFFRYLQVETPERLVQCQQILAIPSKRCARTAVNYLPKEDLSAVLSQPDLTTFDGRRDAVLLSVLYDTGSRVQELIDLRVSDVRLDSPAQIKLTGKGKKTRIVPLLSRTVALLVEYMQEQKLDRLSHPDYPLFSNRRGEHLSRSGVRYILIKYADQARKQQPGIQGKISPHTMRHSKAMHLLHAGNPAVVIQAILGHTDIRTTDIYARANLEMMREALQKAENNESPSELPIWKDNKGLMNWLRSL